MDPAVRDRELAHLYDLEYRDYTADLDFYTQYSLLLDPDNKLPVMELGCGTGRVLLALAEAGFQVIGIDQSPGMLALLREKAEASKLLGRITLEETDMASLSDEGPGGVNIAFCALNTFAYLRSTEEQLAMLRGVRTRLVPGGLLVLDLTPPYPDALPPSGGELILQGTYQADDGATVRKLVATRECPSTQSHEIAILYDIESADGSLRRVSHDFTLRWTGRYEMELLLAAAGCEVEQIYGSYDLDPFGDTSERMIFVARSTA
jgi:SAM-dependent methyltransferase